MSAVLESTRSFLFKRRKPFLVIGGIAGGCYLAGKYALDKLRQVQIKMVEERRDKENLRRRFAQNQEDCTFTVLALLPTLGDQLFESMNVEDLTSQLQKSRPFPASVPRIGAENTLVSGPPQAEAQQQPETGGAQTTTEPTGGSDEQVNGSASAVEADSKPYDLSESSGEVDIEQKEKQEEKADDSRAGASQYAAARPLDPHAPPFVSRVMSVAGATHVAHATKAEPAAPAASDKVQSAEETAPVSTDSTTPGAPTEPEKTDNAEASVPAVDHVAPADTQPSEQVSAIATSATALDRIGEPLPPPVRADTRLPAGAAVTENGARQACESPAGVSEPTEPAPLTEEQILAEKKAKLALWNELKVVAFARTLTSIYSIVLLALQTHIQLNLIGRYAYLASVSSLAKPAPPDHRIDVNEAGCFDGFSVDHSFAQEGLRSRQTLSANCKEGGEAREIGEGLSHETERIYLTFSWWFLHRGWNLVAQRVRVAVEETFGNVGLKTQLSWTEFHQLLSSARRKIEYEVLGEEQQCATSSGSHPEKGGDPRSSAVSEVSGTTRGSKRLLAKRLNFLEALFPTSLEEELYVLVEAGAIPPKTPVSTIASDAQLRSLLDETKDFIDSRDFRLVLRLSLDKAFAVFEDALKPAFGVVDEIVQEGARFQELNEDGELGHKVRLAALFPTVAKQSQLAIHGVPNEYVEALAEIKELRALSAVIYSAWSKP
ncbi:Peroxin-3-domain-containing protein [Tilletiaria anomala UBC 951]|uniref:Peroxin-3-domain-containing protein n=1 Tax=Tilletiaria anomala (strain ATCC 24038 / CBS 436.72 / UBC 951) TaxID=1037660 RepID=A0A066W493_TILAU|nr:Peroxin-3-domain-containing protein [Tilletiaria anomala UBC 951]KDN45615.1 Peroxin-3-domain-containing protein [Tilletiaria anomala UBC 951]